MDSVLHENTSFEGVDFTARASSPREFTDCIFINCNFSKADLGSDDFIDCQFRNCDLSMAVMENTGLQNARFNGCKMMGIDFSRCNNFNFALTCTACPLDFCSFFKKKMKKTVFTDCSMKEVDFTETDLTQAIFNNCDLLQAVFVRSLLEKADFRTALHYALDPELNKLKKAQFSFPGAAGLLVKYDIDLS
jgi:fluoroquinolone resistance protein